MHWAVNPSRNNTRNLEMSYCPDFIIATKKELVNQLWFGEGNVHFRKRPTAQCESRTLYDNANIGRCKEKLSHMFEGKIESLKDMIAEHDDSLFSDLTGKLQTV